MPPPDPPSPDSFEDTTRHVRRAVEGSQDSVAWLVERFSPLLLAQALHRLGPHLRRLYDPEDLVQEVWAVSLPRLAGLGPRDGRFTPVVLKFLSTTLLYRVQNLLQKHLRGGAQDGAHEVSATFSELPAATGRLISGAVRSEQQETLRAAIDRLPEVDRQILVLRGIEQNPVQEVAALLKLKPNTVTVKYRRALERLREKLPGSVFEELQD
jgi:RNA polymerase sigma-70 factor (ECF subfamily)